MSCVETRLRVRYAETDQMGIAYYANYLVWMEVGRVEYCKARGFNYRDMEREDGAFLVVVAAECRYLAPTRDRSCDARPGIEVSHGSLWVRATQRRHRRDGRHWLDQPPGL